LTITYHVLHYFGSLQYEHEPFRVFNFFAKWLDVGRLLQLPLQQSNSTLLAHIGVDFTCYSDNINVLLCMLDNRYLHSHINEVARLH